jgi:hypothetical protein
MKIRFGLFHGFKTTIIIKTTGVRIPGQKRGSTEKPQE